MPTIFSKNCPICNCVLTYTLKSSLTRSIKDNAKCDKCNRSSKEYKDRQRKQCIGSGNPMYGKNVYDVWVEKYGKEEADRKMDILNKKRSENAKGSRNNMFGKSTPKCGGKGISGYYKDFYFRSLHELYYILTVLEPNNIPIVSAERKDLTIPYINYDGSQRTYRADFIVGNTLIEIKPKRLVNSPLVNIKKEAAIKFCESKGMKYDLITFNTIDYSTIEEKYKLGEIKIDERKRDWFEKTLLDRSKNTIE